MPRRFFIAFDLGGTNLKAALIDGNFRVVSRRSLATGGFINKKSLISGIRSCVRSIIFDNNLQKDQVIGVGLGVPGPTDPRRGLVYFLPNIPGWKNVRLRDILERALGLSVFVDNDVKLATEAEYLFGRGSGYRNILCITLGTGIGGGLILNGRLFRGRDNVAGEFGHIPLNESGPRCNCGGVACIEAYIGNKKILKEAERVFKRGISLEELSARAHSGDKRASGIWREAGRKLGIALCAAINLLNLDAVIVGGGIAGAGKPLFGSIRDTIKKRAMGPQSRRVRLFKSGLGGDAGLLGAALLVKRKGSVG